MKLCTMLYVSRNTLGEPKDGLLGQVREILETSEAYNRANDITGALIFDRDWYVQVIEGDVEAIWALGERLLADPRHRSIGLVGMRGIGKRSFGNWWMGCCERGPANIEVFRRWLVDGEFRPDEMDEAAIMSLMKEIALIGYDRRVRADQDGGSAVGRSQNPVTRVCPH